MNITEYIRMRNLQRVNAVPPDLAHKFDLTDTVDFYADTHGTRYVGLCEARNLFAAWKPEATATGELDKSYPILKSF